VRGLFAFVAFSIKKKYTLYMQYIQRSFFNHFRTQISTRNVNVGRNSTSLQNKEIRYCSRAIRIRKAFVVTMESPFFARINSCLKEIEVFFFLFKIADLYKRVAILTDRLISFVSFMEW